MVAGTQKAGARSPWTASGVLLLALGLGACGDEGGSVTSAGSGPSSASASASGSGTEAPAFTEAEATTAAEYTLTDFKFEGPMKVKGPKVFVSAVNKGTQQHELEILGADGEAVGEVEAFDPGTDAEPLAASLEPGSYTMQCILETPDGRSHKDLGMVATLVVE